MKRLAVVLILALAPTLQAQTAIRVVPGTREDWRAAVNEARAQSHNAGETRCVGGAADSRVLWELTHADSAEVLAHEAIHARQLAVNCDSVMAVWDTNRLAKMDAEAEALCGGMRAADVPRTWWHGRTVRAAAFWGRFSTVTFDEAMAAYGRWCGV